MVFHFNTIGMNPKLIPPVLAEKPLWVENRGHNTTGVQLRMPGITQVSIVRARRKLLISFLGPHSFVLLSWGLGAEGRFPVLTAPLHSIFLR